MTSLGEQASRNRACLRDENDARERERRSAPDAGEDTHLYACECGRSSCISGIYLTRAEYENVRALEASFIVTCDHHDPATDAVVWENGRWAVVEAVRGDAAPPPERTLDDWPRRGRGGGGNPTERNTS